MENENRGHFKAISIMIIVATLAMFKVYLANETYYTSRDIQKISSKISALKEEKNIIQLKIEKLKYKNTITDPLFTYKKEETIDASSDVESIKQNIQVAEPKKEKKKDTKELFKNINTEDIF